MYDVSSISNAIANEVPESCRFLSLPHSLALQLERLVPLQNYCTALSNVRVVSRDVRTAPDKHIVGTRHDQTLLPNVLRRVVKMPFVNVHERYKERIAPRHCAMALVSRVRVHSVRHIHSEGDRALELESPIRMQLFPLGQLKDETSVRVDDRTRLSDKVQRLVHADALVPHQVRDRHRRRAGDTLHTVQEDPSSARASTLDEVKHTVKVPSNVLRRVVTESYVVVAELFWERRWGHAGGAIDDMGDAVLKQERLVLGSNGAPNV